MKRILLVIFFFSLFSTKCGIYSPYGGQTSGAKTFSVKTFKTQAPLSGASFAQNFTESLRDLVLRQSTLSLASDDGELRFSGSITGYSVTPVAVQGDDQSALSRLTITIKVKYENTLEESLSFEKSFTKFTDYESSQDLFTIEEALQEEVTTLLTQEIFNASLGNW